MSRVNARGPRLGSQAEVCSRGEETVRHRKEQARGQYSSGCGAALGSTIQVRQVWMDMDIHSRGRARSVGHRPGWLGWLGWPGWPGWLGCCWRLLGCWAAGRLGQLGGPEGLVERGVGQGMGGVLFPPQKGTEAAGQSTEYMVVASCQRVAGAPYPMLPSRKHPEHPTAGMRKVPNG